jgi:putative ABC transport system substrate-binding protein
MKRREFLTGLVVAATRVGPANSQQRSRIPQVGLLSPETSNEGRVNGFREGLKELGYIEGQNIQVEYRWANGAYDRLHEFAVELVSRNVDVIVAYVTQASIEAKKATPKIPIVMVGVADPVAAGLVTSLAHPGGNVTGTSSIAADLVGKQIELLREIVPKISRISALWNPANVVFQQIQLRQVEAARQTSGIDIQLVEARSPNDFASAFATMRKEGTDALIILGEPVFESNFATLARLGLEGSAPDRWCTERFCSGGVSWLTALVFSNDISARQRT